MGLCGKEAWGWGGCLSWLGAWLFAAVINIVYVGRLGLERQKGKMPCSVAKASLKLCDCTPARRLRLFLGRAAHAGLCDHAHPGMKQASKKLNHHHSTLLPSFHCSYTHVLVKQ